MTQITYAEYETARQATAMLDGAATYERSIDQDAWYALLRPACSGSSGVVTLVADYGPILPHVGTSSFVIDCRPIKRVLKLVTPEVTAGFRKVVGLSVVEQMQELLAALSLNKSQLAQVLRVTRPTLYDWLRGSEPSAVNAERIHSLLGVLARAGVSAANPLNARFVRRPMDLDAPSLVELFSADPLDEERIIGAIGQAQALAGAASRRRTEREDRLRALGFEDPSSEQRTEQLAKNMALQDWPKR